MKTIDSYTDTNISAPTMQTVLRTLDAQARQYDIATQMQLNEARARAIAATRAKTPFWRSTPVLAAAFAMSAALSFIVLTQPNDVPTSAELEATALFEATFGAEVANQEPSAEVSSAEVFWDAGVGETALDEAVVDEAVVANDLEFYAWLSESTNARRTPTGSGS